MWPPFEKGRFFDGDGFQTAKKAKVYVLAFRRAADEKLPVAELAESFESHRLVESLGDFRYGREEFTRRSP